VLEVIEKAAGKICCTSSRHPTKEVVRDIKLMMMVERECLIYRVTQGRTPMDFFFLLNFDFCILLAKIKVETQTNT